MSQKKIQQYNLSKICMKHPKQNLKNKNKFQYTMIIFKKKETFYNNNSTLKS